MIINDSCGYLPDSSDIRRSPVGTYTATTTGMVTLEVINTRTGAYTLNVENYIDNIKVYPQNPDFTATPHELSYASAGSSALGLNAGPSFAWKDYVIFTGITGTWPGFKLNGHNIPLNLDTWSMTAFTLINSPVYQNFMGTLDGSGTATATFAFFSALPPEAIGLPMYFAYVVLNAPGKTPVIYSSHYVIVFFTL